MLSAEVCICLLFSRPFLNNFSRWSSEFLSLLFCCVSVLNWHLSAVTYSLYKLIKDEEIKPPGVTYDVNTMPQSNANTVPQYPGVTTVTIYPSVDKAPVYPNINTALQWFKSLIWPTDFPLFAIYCLFFFVQMDI